MVPLYLDDCLMRKGVVRQLRAAGHSIFLPSELGVEGQKDELHLETATRLGAVLVSQNQGDFVKRHRAWQADGRQHAGILTTQQLGTGIILAQLERAGRLLSPEIAGNQLMVLALFDTEGNASAYVVSLHP